MDEDQKQILESWEGRRHSKETKQQTPRKITRFERVDRAITHAVSGGPRVTPEMAREIEQRVQERLIEREIRRQVNARTTHEQTVGFHLKSHRFSEQTHRAAEKLNFTATRIEPKFMNGWKRTRGLR